ncbi:MAG: TIGR04076 family protein [Erysipelotrichaceae bacterium]|nr:TIGR04076 family protein [Erysipelotrichaceae bacterium]
MKKCKITVLKREFYKDLADEYIPIPDFGPCHMMKEGDVFITGGPFGNQMPKGFCDMAWQSICLQATTLAGGGKVFGHDDVHIACCNDGVRPVIFRLEACEDDEQPQF